MQGGFKLSVSRIELKPFIDKKLAQNIKVLFYSQMQSCSFKIIDCGDKLCFWLFACCSDDIFDLN